MKKVLSIWMAIIMIMIPFYTSTALALPSIEITDIHGEDNAKDLTATPKIGYLKTAGDTFYMTIMASNDGDPINHLQIKAQGWWAGDLTADTCTSQANGYECSLEVAQPTLNPTEYTVTAGLYLSGSQPTRTDTAKVYGDEAAPYITGLKLDKNVTKGDLTLRISAEERLATGTPATDKCAGFDHISIYVSDDENNDLSSLYEQFTPTTTSRCTFTNQIYQLSSSLSGFSDGKHALCIVAVDKVNHPDEAGLLNANEPYAECTQVYVDNTAPSIDSFEVLYDEPGKEDQPLLAVSTQQVNIKARVNITGIEFGTGIGQMTEEQVKQKTNATFTGLSITGKKPNVCVYDASAEVFSCDWEGTYQGTTSFRPAATVKSADMAGNLAQEIINAEHTIQYYAQGPVVTGISSNYGTLLGKDNILIVDVAPGAPLDDDSISIRLQELDPQYVETDTPGTRSERCDNNLRKCYYNLTQGHMRGTKQIQSLAEGREENISLRWYPSDSEDAIGNTGFGEAIDFYMFVDTKKPYVNDLKIEKIPGTATAPGNALVKGDSIKFTFNVTDARPVKATLNLSGIIESTGAWTGGDSTITCNPTGNNNYKCEFTTTKIDTNVYTTYPVKFKIEDETGNIQTNIRDDESANITVFFREDGAQPDYWEMESAKFPGPFDRALAGVISMPIYAEIKLKPKGTLTDIGMVTATAQDCYAATAGDDIDSWLSVKTPVLTNTDDGDGTFYLSLALAKTDFTVNNVKITCPIDIYTKRKVNAENYTLTVDPEREYANLTIQFFNNPLGEYSDELKSEIKDTMDNIWTDLEFIGTIKQIIQYGKDICGVIETWNEIITGLGSMAAFLHTTGIWEGAAVALDDVARSLSFGEVNSFIGQEPANVEIDPATGKRKAPVTLNQGIFDVCNYVTCKYNLYELDWSQLLGEQGEDTIFSAFEQGGANCAKTKHDGELDVYSQDNPACWLQDFASKEGGISVQTNPQDSLIASLQTGCLPGVIDNIDEMSQIECTYGLCLINSVSEGIAYDDTIDGVPSVCKAVRNYGWCKWTVGEIFALVPLSGVIQNMLQKFTDMLSDPITALFGIGGIVCTNLPPGIGLSICHIVFHSLHITEIVDQFAHFDDTFGAQFDNFGKIRTDACEEFRTKYDELFGGEE